MSKPREIAEERFARGEISEDEFVEILEVLGKERTDSSSASLVQEISDSADRVGEMPVEPSEKGISLSIFSRVYRWFWSHFPELQNPGENVIMEPGEDAILVVRNAPKKHIISYLSLIGVGLYVVVNLDNLPITPTSWPSKSLMAIHFFLQGIHATYLEYMVKGTALALLTLLFYICINVLFRLLFRPLNNQTVLIVTNNGIQAEGLLNGDLVCWEDIESVHFSKSKHSYKIELVLYDKKPTQTKKIFSKKPMRNFISLSSMADMNIETVYSKIVDIRTHLEAPMGQKNRPLINLVDIPSSRAQTRSFNAPHRLVRLTFWPQIFYHVIFALITILPSSEKMQTAQRFIEFWETPPFSYIYMFIIIAGIGAFMFFVYRASQNANLLDPNNFDHSPWGTVAWYFVPLAWFYMPYKVMKQTWESSGGTTNYLVTMWWVSFWLFYVGEYGAIYILKAAEIEQNVGTVHYLYFGFFQIFVAVSIYIALKLVERLSDLQKYGSVTTHSDDH